MTTHTGHTSGPWSVVRFSDETVSIIIGPGGDERICEMHSNEEPESRIDANACLIAAAPELLGELKNAIAALRIANIAGKSCFSIQVVRDAEAAIAKAEGRG